MAQKLDLSRATTGEWLVTPTHMTMQGVNHLQTFGVLATGAGAACEQFVGRAHPKNGQADERATVEMDARLFAASKAMATLLLQALAYEEDAFRLDLPVDADDLVAWFSEWRADVCGVLEIAATDQTRPPASRPANPSCNSTSSTDGAGS